MFVSELINSNGGELPQEFLSCLPIYCPDERCQALTEIQETLTGLHCSNPKCPTKIAKRIDAIAKTLGIKDMGIAKANEFINRHNTTNPLAIFGFTTENGDTFGDSTSIEVSKKLEDRIQAKKKFTLWEFVKTANLPYIQTSAMHLFGDYDSLDDAYAPIKEGGVEYIREKLKIGTEGTVSVKAIKIYTTLLEFEKDLREGIEYVDIIPTHIDGMKTYKIVISHDVGNGFKTKSEYYDYINTLNPNVRVERLPNNNKSMDFLIWAGADYDNPVNSGYRITNKVKQVMGWIEKGESVQIVSPKQFIEIVSKGG